MNHEEMNQRFSRLENEIAELNKKLSTLMPSEDEKKRRDEQFEPPRESWRLNFLRKR